MEPVVVFIRCGLVLLALLAVTLFDAQSGIVLAEDGTAPAKEAKPSAQAEELLRRINHERKEHGKPPLRFDRRLTAAATLHASAMAEQKTLSHELTGPYGKLPDRLEYVGYPWKSVRENIAAGYRTTEEAVAGWMGSILHSENILSEDVTETGIGIAPGADGMPYYCQVFAAPK